MNGELWVVSLLFLGSASLVILSGTYLAKYGDLLADMTGWGRLWVGTLLVAMATSLPELVTIISAVRLPSPQLAIGDALGSTMVNMFGLAVVALLAGGREFFRRVSPQQAYIAGLAIFLTLVAMAMGAISPSLSVAEVGVAALAILVLYIVGMRLVYLRRPAGDNLSANPEGPVLTLRRVWLLFGLASLGIVAAAPVLAYSADQIAENTALEASFVGVLGVGVVTSMPEAAVAIAALRYGAVDLLVGNLYGSCAFNILILALADPFYRQGPLFNELGRAEQAAGLFGVLLMTLGLAQFLLRGRDFGRLPVIPTCLAMCLLYFGGVYMVYQLS